MWNYFVESVTGTKTQVNQDYLAVNKREGSVLAILCDGLGGQKCGEVASRLCVKSMTDSYLDEYDPSYDSNWMKDMSQEANRFIHDYSVIHTKCSGMATTMVSLMIKENEGFIVNVGDSRLYSYKQNVLSQITDDDSMIWELYKRDKLKKEQLVKHPSGHIITKAIGTIRAIDIQVNQIGISSKELFLLCSDGLTDSVKDEELKAIIDGKDNLSLIGKQLIDKALKEGSNDDISIILLSNYIE